MSAFGACFVYVRESADDEVERALLLAQRDVAVALFVRTRDFTIALRISELEAKLRSIGG